MFSRQFGRILAGAGFASVLILTFFLPSEAKAEQQKEGNGDKYILARVAEAEFGIAWCDGALRYYRPYRSDPFIEFISLSEGQKRQLFPEIEMKSDWEPSGLQITKGQRKEDHVSEGDSVVPPWEPVIRPVSLSPIDGVLEVLATGKLESLWRQTIEAQENADSSTLRFRYTKIERKGDEPLKITVKFLPWLEDVGIPFFAISSGRTTELTSLRNTSEGETKILIPFWEKGHELFLSVTPSRAVSLSQPYPFRGGRDLTFEVGQADEAVLEVMDRRVSSPRSCGPLTLRLNERNAATALVVGNLSLVRVEAFEEDCFQSRRGYQQPWNVAKRGNAIFSAEGRLKNLWHEEINAEPGQVHYTFTRKGGRNEVAGIHIFIPYWMVGAKVEIELPNGKKVNEWDQKPLRLGMEARAIAILPAGSKLVFFPTASERVVIECEGSYELSLYRKKLNQYKEPADLSDSPEFYQTFPKQGVITCYPPAGILLRSREAQFGIRLRYERVYTGLPERPPQAMPHLPHTGLKILDQDTVVKAQSPHWQVVHSKEMGGAITEIVFPYGTGKNILNSQEEIYVQIAGKTYSNLYEKHPQIQKEADHLHVKGMLTASDGAASNVSYEVTYHYKSYGLKRNVVFHFPKGTRVERVGVLKLNCVPRLDLCGYKPCVAEVKKAVFPGEPVAEGKTIVGGYVSLFQRGIEGIDFVTDSDAYGWLYQITHKKDQGYIAVVENEGGGPTLLVEPYCGEALQVEGKKTYGCYLGLPNLRQGLPKHYFVAWCFPWTSYAKSPDPKSYLCTPEILNYVKEKGITAVQGHSWGLLPTGGFPPDAPSPEQAKQIEQVKNTVKMIQNSGLKVFPFCSRLLGPRVTANKEHGKEWEMLNSAGKRLQCGTYGDYMCFESGWTHYLKKQIIAYRDFANYDGMYYDFWYPSLCCNPRHTKTGGVHSVIDSLLDLGEWTRKNIPIIYGHTGYYPLIVLENLTDCVWVGEEYPYWYTMPGRISSLEELGEHFQFIPHTQRIIDPRLTYCWFRLGKIGGDVRAQPEDVREFLVKLLLNGLFTSLHRASCGAMTSGEFMEKSAPVLDLFEAFKNVEFERFRFANWKQQGAVITDNPAVRAAVYWNETEAVLVLANSESPSVQTFTARVNTQTFGWPQKGHCRLTLAHNPKPQFLSMEDLKKQGLSAKLPGYGYLVLRITTR